MYPHSWSPCLDVVSQRQVCVCVLRVCMCACAECIFRWRCGSASRAIAQCHSQHTLQNTTLQMVYGTDTGSILRAAAAAASTSSSAAQQASAASIVSGAHVSVSQPPNAAAGCSTNNSNHSSNNSSNSAMRSAAQGETGSSGHSTQHSTTQQGTSQHNTAQHTTPHQGGSNNRGGAGSSSNTSNSRGGGPGNSRQFSSISNSVSANSVSNSENRGFSSVSGSSSQHSVPGQPSHGSAVKSCSGHLSGHLSAASRNASLIGSRGGGVLGLSGFQIAGGCPSSSAAALSSQVRLCGIRGQQNVVCFCDVVCIFTWIASSESKQSQIDSCRHITTKQTTCHNRILS